VNKMLKKIILRALNKICYQLVRLTSTGPESQIHGIPGISCYWLFFNSWLYVSEFSDAI